MENRTFQSPDLRLEFGFCSPSWNRKRKYVSWNHWFSTKITLESKAKCDRYKLFELAHYAGSVILEIGLPAGGNGGHLVSGAMDGGHREVQYYGIDTALHNVVEARRKFDRGRSKGHSVFLLGSLSDFQKTFPVTPSLVVINDLQELRKLQGQLATFLSDGAPVFVRNWFVDRTDTEPVPTGPSFESFGRFGNSMLLRCRSVGDEVPQSFSQIEFERLRRHTAGDPQPISEMNFDGIEKNKSKFLKTGDNSGKQWPFVEPAEYHPPTLPDGTPWPKISIVTPTYNQGPFIEETINSIINQGYPNLEYIVIDGASTDSTPEILQKYRGSIDHLISEKDKGQSDAINKGMKLATGEILTWLNSDDMLTPGTLFAMAMAFWKSKADMVVGAVHLLKDGKVVDEHLTSCIDGPLQLSELLDLDRNWLQGRFFFQPELMFTRDLWDRAGGYVDTTLYYSMDHELWLRFAIAGANMHVIGRPTVLYRMHEEQKTHADYRPELRGVNQRYIEKYGAPSDHLSILQPKNYRATFVNDVGPRWGAGIAHRRLRDSLDAARHCTSFVSFESETSSEIKSVDDVYREIEATNPDIVVLGNLHHCPGGINLIERVSSRWATTFVMHDVWLATGKCPYTGTCNKFESQCDASCPVAGQYPPVAPEKIESTFNEKLRVLARSQKLTVLTNSNWCTDIAKKSKITRSKDVKTLKYGFPTHIYKPRDRNLCREILGLPQDGFIVLFGSVNLEDERKGSRHIIKALHQLQLKDVVPVCLGNSPTDDGMPPGTVMMGYVSDPWRSAMIYSAADLFVGPSLEEAFGQVFIEAAACGTPSVAYRVGGVEQSLVDGVTGKLAASVHPSSLADEIYKLYKDSNYRKQLGFWGRLEVENEWSYRSAYHQFNASIREFASKIGFLPPARISFDPSKFQSSLASIGGLLATDRVDYLEGFDNKETIQVKDGEVFTEARWANKTVSEMKVRIIGLDSKSLWAKCLNPLQFQTITISTNGEYLGSAEIPVGEFWEPIDICLARKLEPGEHLIRLEFTQIRSDNQRNMALMFLETTSRALGIEKTAKTIVRAA